MENELKNYVRLDLPGRFNEIDVLIRQFSRVINIFQKEILPPYEILIQPSSICNLYCKWCIGNYVASKKDKILPSTLHNKEFMKKLVQDIVNYKKIAPSYTDIGKMEEFRVENVSFSGITGEPMISKESTLYGMDYLVDNGIRVGLFTNGTLLDEKTFETIVKIGYVLISLDSSNDKGSVTYSVAILAKNDIINYYNMKEHRYDKKL